MLHDGKIVLESKLSMLEFSSLERYSLYRLWLK